MNTHNDIEVLCEWRIHMAHEKALRNALALCNDKNLETFTKDTEGGLELYAPMPYKYVGKTYWKYMEDHGHTRTQYSECLCSKRK